MLPKISCQYRAVAWMITPVCILRSILAQTQTANTCFRHSNGPILCRALVFSLPEWFAVVKVTHGQDFGQRFGWRSVNLNSQQRPPSSAQHLTNTRRHWLNNNNQLLAAEIGPILCRIISFGNSHLGTRRKIFVWNYQTICTEKIYKAIYVFFNNDNSKKY